MQYSDEFRFLLHYLKHNTSFTDMIEDVSGKIYFEDKRLLFAGLLFSLVFNFTLYF
jgi:hypothetical protein